MIYTHARKLIGDFGEGLVTYVLIRKGFEVANVDHVGADLIAERMGERWAVSVKTRLFKAHSKESRMVTIEHSDLKKLQVFADRFGMSPVFAQVVSVVDDKIIHMFIFKVASLESVLPLNENGHSLRFGDKYLKGRSENRKVDYSYWRDTLSSNIFGNANV